MNALASLFVAALAASAPQAEIRNVRISSPKILLSREKSDSDVQVAGQFKVEMSFAKKTAKKPVVRLACLCEVNGTLIANCIFLDKPDTNKGLSRSEIQAALKASGLKESGKESEKFRADPSKFTPFLSEVSKETYMSATYGTPELNRGFFRLGRSKAIPKLLLFRIEVWQNGVLVAKHDSSRTGLGAYDIPADWYEWKKYPQKFKYAEIR